MPHHIINVTLVDPGTADALRSHNPMEVMRGDTVEWILPEDLRIEFRGFLPHRRELSISGPGTHPFTAPPPPTPPTVGQQFTVSTVKTVTASGIYFYSIFRGDQEIKWAAPVFTAGSFHALFGCLVVHPPD